jgi:predicted AAA+ superfamily ATPase
LLRPDDFGFVFQNLVYLILREKLRWSNSHIHFWRTRGKAEIDFVLDTGREVIPVEAKFKDMLKPSPPRVFEGFIEKYRPPYCLVVNKNLRETVKIRETEVRFITIWDLLMKMEFI